jgi:hypothetical protein
MQADDFDNCTLLAGADFDDGALEALAARVEAAFPELDIDALRGDQPLYPVVFSLE